MCPCTRILSASGFDLTVTLGATGGPAPRMLGTAFLHRGTIRQSTFRTEGNYYRNGGGGEGGGRLRKGRRLGSLRLPVRRRRRASDRTAHQRPAPAEPRRRNDPTEARRAAGARCALSRSRRGAGEGGSSRARAAAAQRRVHMQAGTHRRARTHALHRPTMLSLSRGPQRAPTSPSTATSSAAPTRPRPRSRAPPSPPPSRSAGRTARGAAATPPARR